jgi:tripartite ATP-independent transporter DctM subunit
MITIYIMCRINPTLGPRGPKATFKEQIFSLKDSWGVLVLFVVVIGGMYMGIFTATEAAGIGAFGAFLFALLTKKLTFKGFGDSLTETAKTTAMVLMILIGAAILGYFLAVTRLPYELSNYVAALPVNRYIILIIIIVFYIFIGAFMSALAMVVLTVPIIFPVVVALNFDPIWFGIIIVRVVEMGQITPPVGLNVYILQGVAKDVPMFTISGVLYRF